MTIQRMLAQEKTEASGDNLSAVVFFNFFLFAYRKVPRTSTGLPPAILRFDRLINGPLEALVRTWTEDRPAETVISDSKFVEELKRKLQLGGNLPRAISGKLVRDMHLSTIRKYTTKSLNTGIVLLLSNSGNNKLDIGWQGSYTVLEKIARINYSIFIRCKSKIYHINLICKSLDRAGSQSVQILALAVATEVDD